MSIISIRGGYNDSSLLGKFIFYCSSLSHLSLCYMYMQLSHSLCLLCHFLSGDLSFACSGAYQYNHVLPACHKSCHVHVHTCISTLLFYHSLLYITYPSLALSSTIPRFFPSLHPSLLLYMFLLPPSPLSSLLQPACKLKKTGHGDISNSVCSRSRI